MDNKSGPRSNSILFPLSLCDVSAQPFFSTRFRFYLPTFLKYFLRKKSFGSYLIPALLLFEPNSQFSRIRNFPDWIMFGWIKFPSVDLTIQIQESKDLTWSEPDGTKRFVINLFMYVKHQTSFERFIVIGYSFADVVYKDYPKWCLTTSPFPPAVDFKANSFALKAHLQNKSLISLSGWLV